MEVVEEAMAEVEDVEDTANVDTVELLSSPAAASVAAFFAATLILSSISFSIFSASRLNESCSCREWKFPRSRKRERRVEREERTGGGKGYEVEEEEDDDDEVEGGILLLCLGGES